MTNFEHPGQSPKPKIPFNPIEYGMQPEINEEDEALVAMSEGDLKLFLAEWGISMTEKSYMQKEISMEAFHLMREAFFMTIDERRRELGLDDRPRPV